MLRVYEAASGGKAASGGESAFNGAAAVVSGLNDEPLSASCNCVGDRMQAV